MNPDNAAASDNAVANPSRRTFVKGIAGAALGATAARRSSFAAPAFLQNRTIVFAVQDTDLPKVQPLIDEYAAQRNISIQPEPSPFAGLLEKLTINLSQATGAYDVVSMDDPWMPEFAGGKYLLDLREEMEQRGHPPDTDIVPELLALGDFPPGSGLRGIPWVGNVQVFARRTDVLQDLGLPVPQTWDDVLVQAQAIDEAKRAAGLYGFGLRGRAPNPAATSFLPVLRGFGTDLFDANWEPQLDTPQALAAIEAHLALAALAPPGVENVGHEENGRNFADGLVALSADIWPDQLLSIFDPERSKVAGKVEIASEPAQPDVRPATMTGNWLLGIPQGSKQVDAALEFVLWLTDREQQKRLLLDQSVPATRISVLQDTDAVAKFPFLPGLLAAARNAVPRPRTPHYNAVEAIYGGYVADAIAGRITGAEAMRAANEEIRAKMVREGVLEE